MKRHNIILRLFIIPIFIINFLHLGCSKLNSNDAIELVSKAYKKFVIAIGEKPNFKNLPQYMMLLPQSQDELAIALVPYLKNVLKKRRISRKKFSIKISQALTSYKYATILEKKIKLINPYFDGDMYGAVKKSLEYLRRGLPTFHSEAQGEVNLFNYSNLPLAILKMRSNWRKQDFSTLYFFHTENDRDLFEKNLNKLKQNLHKLVGVAKLLGKSGLKLYNMNFLQFYETVMHHIYKQITSSPSGVMKRIKNDYFFFMVDKIKDISPQLLNLIKRRELHNILAPSFKINFTKNRSLSFTKEGKYWRFPVLPNYFWKIRLFYNK